MNTRGLTLVETIVTISVLVIVNVSLLATFVMLKASGLNMRHHLQAIEILSSQLENLKNQDYSSISAISDQQITIDDNNTMVDLSDDTVGLYTQVVTETLDPSLINKYKTVSVSIVWQEGTYLGTREISESLVTLINN